MENRTRAKMPVAERAKQFMPFAAVKGLNEALSKKENELSLVQKAELLEDMVDMSTERTPIDDEYV